MKGYTVVEGSSRYDLVKKVEEKLLKGWTCQGGVSVYISGFYTFYCQAMVK